MTLDEPSSDDLIMTIEEVPFYIDASTEEAIEGEELIVDYNDVRGFRLFTPSRILSYGISII